MRPQPDALTSREREVLDLIRVGLTNEGIASRLDISLAGAKYHVSQILSKLGVATREGAAAVRRRGARWWAAWRLWAKIAGAGRWRRLWRAGGLAWASASEAARSADARSNHSPPLRFALKR